MRESDLERLEEIARRARELPPMARVALETLANPEEVRRLLQDEFNKSLRAHESMEDLIRRIRHVSEVSRSRAETIARTEKTRASNSERYAQAIDEYLQQHRRAVKNHRKRPVLPVFQWVNPRTAKEPRPHHVEISGSQRAVGEEFLPDLLYPGDPDAPASETINCHCYIRRKRRADEGR